MVLGGTRGFCLVVGGSGLGLGGSRWLWVVLGGSELGLGGSRWFMVVLGVSRWFWVVLGGSRWFSQQNPLVGLQRHRLGCSFALVHFSFDIKATWTHPIIWR